MSKVYQVAGRDQLAALATPIRHDILDRLTALGPLSVRAIADALGRPPTSIYHHLSLLEQLGLVQGVPAGAGRSERGRPALVYKAVAATIRLTQASLRSEHRDLVARVAKAAGAQAARDFGEGLADPGRIVAGGARNHGFFRAIGAPSPERLERINALLEELAELIWSPDPDPGPLISLAWFVAPLGPPASAAGRVRKAKGKASSDRK